MSDTNPPEVTPEEVVETEKVPEESQPQEGKPVGAATIVQDDPIEQFPAHDENITSQ